MPTPPLPVLGRRVLVALALAVLAGAALAVSSVSTPVTVVADDEQIELRTHGDTVAAALAAAEVELGPDDAVTPALGTSLEHDLVIEVVRAVAIAVEVDGEEHELATVADRVGEVLDEVGVELGPHDLVDPPLYESVVDTEVVVVQRVEYEEQTEQIVLEHDEVRHETDDLERGESRVEQEGREGVKVRTFEVTIVDGEEADRELQDTDVEVEPRDHVVLIGTGEPPPTPTAEPDAPSSTGVWDRLAQCESNGNWQANTGNGYYGGLQFHPDTWRSVGGSGLPHQHSRAEQIRRAQILLDRSGWGQWPACSSRLGLR